MAKRKFGIAGVIVLIIMMMVSSGYAIVLKAEHDEPTGSITDQVMKDMAQKISIATNGRVKMEVYAGCQLSGGKIKTMIQNTILGSTHLAWASAATFTSWDPNIGVCNLPFLVSDYDGYEKLRHVAPMRELLDDWENIGLIGIDYWSRALRQVVNTKKRILTVDDIKGLRFRVMETPLYVSIFKSLDAHPIGMPFGEIFTALKLGTIDGAERPTEFLLTEKWWDLVKYVSIWDYTGDLLVVIGNKNYFEGLAAEDREAIARIVREGGDRKYRMEKEMQLEAIKTLREKGMVVDVLTSEQKAAFRERTKGVYKEFEPNFKPGLIENIEKALAE